MPPPVFAAPFASSADFLTAFDAEIAKGGARDQIVHAARKKVNG